VMGKYLVQYSATQFKGERKFIWNSVPHRRTMPVWMVLSSLVANLRQYASLGWNIKCKSEFIAAIHEY
jgi:hypothetical protein